ncbi:MAG: DNA repair protein RadA [Geminicoccaceae bacterium]|nr:DNA repair protein RadA [Geminicoccaceae bacterium]HRY26198.1 DNA repair protein RadA [Geminicoccaceae bacterium]
MAGTRVQFVCQSCGSVQPKWSGRCDGCGAWNTLVEETSEPLAKGAPVKRRSRRGLDLVSLEGTGQPVQRLVTGIGELDRAVGGGMVAGSAILIGGDPGIGKSTLTLQAAARLALAGKRVVYVSGEESIEQIRMRADRIGLAKAPVELASGTSVDEILGTLDTGPPVDLLIIDSIQTVYLEALDPAPGTVTQLRASAQALTRFAKRRGAALLLIGHVTKEGQIAGPRVLEHMVDTVLYFEGERGHQFRLLRAVKNRFGPANEIGVFEMRESGLEPVANPSALFLAGRDADVSGAAVFAGMEGSRPVLVEIQALVAASPLATPRRAVVGWDSGRLAMLLAVLEARCGLVMGNRDVYLNVAGGLRITEPAADLAVAAALVSSLADRAVPRMTVFFGEVGLGGEVRAVANSEARMKEAAKLGFERVIAPRSRRGDSGEGLAIEELSRLDELLAVMNFSLPEAGTP